MKKAAPETPSIQSLDRGLTILEAVARSNRALPIAQLRELLGINRSSVFRLANTLRRRGFLANPDGRNEYIIGPAVWRLFRNYDWSTLVSFCRHHLRTLADLTGETAHLGVREKRQALFIDHQVSRYQVIAATGRTGEFMPLHSTAHGKALLSDCGLEELTVIFGTEPLTVYTPTTISTLEELARACAVIREQGYSLDQSEQYSEVRCVAAPVRDKEGGIVAAIGISAPTARMSDDRIAEAIRHVTETAKNISAILNV